MSHLRLYVWAACAVLCLSVLSFCEPSDPPQAGLTLADLERAALANSPEIRAAARRVPIAQARLGLAGALDDPSFMFRAWGTPLSRPWDLNRAQNMFSYTQNLPGRGKRALQRQVASEDVELAQAQLETIQRGVLAKLRKGYYDLLRTQEEIRLHDTQFALARQALESVRIKYTVGRVPQQDVLKAELALTRLTDHLVGLRQDRDITEAALNTLMGREPDRELVLSGAYSTPSAVPLLVELQQAALEHRPELVAAALAVKQAETRVKLADKTYTPDFSLSGGYMVMPEGSMARNAYMAELSITLPWLNRGRHDAEKFESSAMLAAQRAEFDSLRAVVFQEIHEALVRIRSLQQVIKLYGDTLRPQSQMSLKAALAAYQTDRTDFLNLLDSQNVALDIEIGYLRACSELEQRMAELELAAGVPIARGERLQAEKAGPTPEVAQ